MMRAASRLVRARRRTNNPFPSSSLPPLPFLYHTRTIQSAGRRLYSDPQQHQTSGRFEADSIPFDTDGQSEPISQSLRQSTITNREREAFRKLFDSLVKSPPTHRKKVAKLSEKSKEQAHAQAQHPEATEVLESATRPRQPPSRVEGIDDLERFPTPLRRMATAATQKIQEQQNLQALDERLKQQEQAEQPAVDDPLVKLREEQHERIERLLSTAATDHDLWRVLEKEVFSLIRSLDLDKQKSQSKEKVKAKSNTEERVDEPGQLAILGPNYPSFLLIAVRQLRTYFPTSTFIFQIVPTIKEIGRSSYVLGASTPLYNEIIAETWQMWSDLQRIDALLREMDNAGLEFDENTLDLLQEIRREGTLAMSGKQGEITRQWWSFEAVQDGWNRVCEWIPEIKARHRALAVRLANEREMQREQLEYEHVDERGEEPDTIPAPGS